MALEFVYRGEKYHLRFDYRNYRQIRGNWEGIDPALIDAVQQAGGKTVRTIRALVFNAEDTCIAAGESSVLFDPKRHHQYRQAVSEGWGKNLDPKCKNDSYNKKLGRKKALTKCLNQLDDKGLRTAAWESYNANTVKRPAISKRQMFSEFLAEQYLKTFFGDLLAGGCAVRMDVSGKDLDVAVAVPKDRPDLLEPARKQVELFKEALNAAMADSAPANSVSGV